MGRGAAVPHGEIARRRLVVLGAAAWLGAATGAAVAQAARLPHVAWVGFGSRVPSDRPVREPWERAFREHGWVDGTGIRLDYRYVEAGAQDRAQRLSRLLDELLAEGVDVIFSPRVEVLLAARQKTRSVPIVFAAIGDPVGAGLVQSFVRPGGNVTGISYDASPAIAGKQLQLLHELLPAARTFGLVAWKGSVDARPFVDAARSAGDREGVALVPFESKDGSDLDEGYAGFARRQVDGVLVLGSAYAFVHRARLVALAARHRLPAMYAMREAVAAGGLMSYGPVIAEQFRRAAAIVDRILKGEKPADLPVEQPTTFEFVVNTGVARSLGLDVPKALLLRADEVLP